MLRQVTVESQLALIVGVLKTFEKQAAKKTGQYTIGQKEPLLARYPTLAVGRDSPTRYKTMHMRVVNERLAPGMEHRHESQLGSERSVKTSVRTRDLPLDSLMDFLVQVRRAGPWLR